MSLYDLTSVIQEAIDQLDDVLGKKRISHEAIKNIRDMLVRMTNKKIIPDFYIRDFLLAIKLVNVLLCILKQFYKILLVSHA